VFWGKETRGRGEGPDPFQLFPCLWEKKKRKKEEGRKLQGRVATRFLPDLVGGRKGKKRALLRREGQKKKRKRESAGALLLPHSKSEGEGKKIGNWTERGGELALRGGTKPLIKERGGKKSRPSFIPPAARPKGKRPVTAFQGKLVKGGGKTDPPITTLRGEGARHFSARRGEGKALQDTAERGPLPSEKKTNEPFSIPGEKKKGARNTCLTGEGGLFSLLRREKKKRWCFILKKGGVLFSPGKRRRPTVL